MKKINILLLLSLLTIPNLSFAICYDDGGYGMMSGWIWPIGGVFMIIFWLLIIGLLFVFIKNGSYGGTHRRSSDSGKALDILKERYAKGEIDKNQFEEMKKSLER